MKKIVREFLRRGVIASGFGPMTLVFFYLILKQRCGVQTLTVNQVCIGIVSLSALAFVAGGMNAVYQIERLPLMLAILIHGGALYVSYLAAYLMNGWLEWGTVPILVFSAVFVLGYLAIWAIIYPINKRNTKRLNAAIERKQRSL